MKLCARRFCFELLAASLAFLLLTSPFLPPSASAQAYQGATLSALQADEFPTITAYLDVHQLDGNFIYGLKPENVRILENDQALAVRELTEIQPGVQFAIAVSLGPALGIRDSLGKSRLDYLIAGLNNWQNEPNEGTNDDLSLVAQDGPEVIHITLPSMILASLRGYQPDARRAVPSLAVLNRALQVVSDPLPRPGMERAILFITPLLPPESLPGLQSISDQASQLGVRFFIWLVASTGDAPTQVKDQLQAMAIQSGGRFQTFTGAETLPDLNEYLQPLRHIYRLSYTSALSTSGDYPVSAEITIDTQVITTAPQNLSLTILPPNPIFVAPPAQILRSASQTASSGKEPALQTAAARLLPEIQPIDILIEFPDGHTRPIVQSTLFVDGQPIEVKTVPPFDAFRWNISDYLDSGAHTLRVEVVDSLGLIGSSAEIPVQVIVQPVASIIQRVVVQHNFILLVVILLIAGSALGLVLLLAGRLQPVTPGKGKPLPRNNAKTKPTRADQPVRQAARLDPLTQPISTQRESPSRQFPKWVLRLPRAAGRMPAHFQATLTPVSHGEETLQEAPIPLTATEISFGRDSSRVSWAIDDLSLEPIHARLIYERDGFRLIDQGTTAGTWVNYSPVPPEGALLEHGDLIHIGRVSFRFKLRTADRIRKATLQPMDKLHDSI